MNALDFAQGKAAVEDAVKRAEAKTSAEVVCVVATESGRYDRAESLAGLALALTGLVLADAAWQAGMSDGAWSHGAPLWVLAAGVAAGFVLGTVLASFVPPLRRLIVSRTELDEEVEAGADRAWVRSRVGSTKARTGVLVYVSLFERRVVVRLDEAVKDPAFAAALCEKAVAGLKAGKREAVLVELIDATADALAGKLPPAAQRSDELPNHLVTLHPR